VISGERFLIGGKNLSLLLHKLNVKKIPFYNLEEIENKILITIEKKDIKNFLAIIEQSWYYKSVEEVGFASFKEKIIKYLGVILGIICFTFGTFAFDNMVLKVEIKADSCFYYDIKNVLKRNNVEKYTWFSNVNLKQLQEEIYAENPLICYSSAVKRGNSLVIRVERANSFSQKVDQTRKSIIAEQDGEILSIVVLRGYPLKKAGDFVKAGEEIVSGEKIEDEKLYSTFVLATVKILCSFYYESQEPKVVALQKAKLLCGQENYYSQDVQEDGNNIKITLKYIKEIGDTV